MPPMQSSWGEADTRPVNSVTERFCAATRRACLSRGREQQSGGCAARLLLGASPWLSNSQLASLAPLARGPTPELAGMGVRRRCASRSTAGLRRSGRTRAQSRSRSSRPDGGDTWQLLSVGAARGALRRPRRASTMLRRRSRVRRSGESPRRRRTGRRGAVLRQGRGPFQAALPGVHGAQRGAGHAAHRLVREGPARTRTRGGYGVGKAEGCGGCTRSAAGAQARSRADPGEIGLYAS